MTGKVVTDLRSIPEDRLSSYECAALARGITHTEAEYDETSLTGAELAALSRNTPAPSSEGFGGVLGVIGILAGPALGIATLFYAIHRLSQ